MGMISQPELSEQRLVSHNPYTSPPSGEQRHVTFLSPLFTTIAGIHERGSRRRLATDHSISPIHSPNKAYVKTRSSLSPAQPPGPYPQVRPYARYVRDLQAAQ